jgi:phage baseplate assembly protein W
MPKGVSTKGLFGGQTFKVKSDIELLKESIYNILTTRKGERAGNPDFGTDLDRLLFNPNLEPYWEAIKLELIKEVELWEPRVAILSMDFVADTDNNKVSLYVYFVDLLTKQVDGLAAMNIGN